MIIPLPLIPVFCDCRSRSKISRGVPTRKRGTQKADQGKQRLHCYFFYFLVLLCFFSCFCCSLSLCVRFYFGGFLFSFIRSLYLCIFVLSSYYVVLAHKYKDLRPYTGGVTVVLGGDNCASSTKATDSRDVDLSDAGTYVAIH